LRNVGVSEKIGSKQRGFRGIGRLGGLGYCRELVFRTKATNEGVVFVQRWDAARLRDLLAPTNTSHGDMAAVIDDISEFYTERRSKHDRDHFFQVELIGIEEDSLLDLPEVRHHLAQVVPVALDFQAFRFARDIDRWLRRAVPDYRTYRISVNDEPLYKLYRDTVPLSRGPGRKANSQHDRIKDVLYLSLCSERDEPLAHTWLAVTDEKGMVSPTSGVCGMRFRCGNMQVGDGAMLEETFQKSNKRFASYMIGEVHVVHQGLVPNARRDGFEANARRNALMRAIAKEVSQPASVSIREASRARSKNRRVRSAEKKRTEAEKSVRKGVLTEGKRAELARSLEEAAGSLSAEEPSQALEIEKIRATRKKVEKEAPNVVDTELQSRYPRPVKEVLKVVLDMVYEDADDKKRAERLIRKIIGRLKSLKLR